MQSKHVLSAPLEKFSVAATPSGNKPRKPRDSVLQENQTLTNCHRFISFFLENFGMIS